MEVGFHFDSTPIAPPGSYMQMQVKPESRHTFGLNANKSWYIGPCLNHYQVFKGALSSNKDKIISDTAKFQHHAITIPHLASANIILKATHQLRDVLTQQPKQASMDELRAIKLLCNVVIGGRRKALPQNSVQIKITQQQQMSPETPIPTLTTPLLIPISTATGETKELPDLDANYVSDDEDNNYNNSAPPVSTWLYNKAK